MMSRKMMVQSAVLALAVGLVSSPASAAQTCSKFYTYTSASSGEYYVQSNFWNSNIKDNDLCLDYAYEPTGKNFTFRNNNNKSSTDGIPMGYPSIYKGCHYGSCTSSSGMPVKVSDLQSASSSWTINTSRIGGKWNASYDLFFDTDKTPGNRYPNGAEIMIWINKRDGSRTDKIYPAGSKDSDATINGASYEVWKGTVNGTPVISYIAKTRTNSVSNLNLKSFIDDAVGKKVVKSTHYLQSVQAGFEPHSGGSGLRSDYFTATVK
jgi:hypothetical protein